MAFRPSIIFLALALGACGSRPASPAESRRVVSRALAPCAAATDRLASQFDAGSAQGRYEAAYAAHDACWGAWTTLGTSDLPAAVAGPCGDTAAQAAGAADAAKDALKSGQPWDEGHYYAAAEGAAKLRKVCAASLGRLGG